MATVIPRFIAPILPSTLRIFWCALLAGALLTAGMACAAEADDPGEIEQAVKAAYLYKFLGYVQWPQRAFPQPDAPFVIGVAANNRMAEALMEVAATHKVHGRNLRIRRVRADDSLADIHLLYISRRERERQPQLLIRAQQRPILTVTESNGCTTRAGIINFRTIDNRVRFDVALGAARRNGLKLSSRLLSVAQSVHNGAP